MMKCPRCNLPQERTDECEYCGFVFDRGLSLKEKIRKSPKEKMIIAIVIIVFFIIPISSGGILYHLWTTVPEWKAKAINKNKISEQKAIEKEIKKYEKKIASNEGYMQRFTKVASSVESLSLQLAEHRKKQDKLYNKKRDAEKRLKIASVLIDVEEVKKVPLTDKQKFAKKLFPIGIIALMVYLILAVCITLLINYLKDRKKLATDT